MVVEEVDLVDVEDVAVGLGEHAGFEAPAAFFQRRFQVDGADDPVFGGVDGQLDDAHAAGGDGQLAGARAFAAVHAPVLGVLGVAAEVAAFDDLLLG